MEKRKVISEYPVGTIYGEDEIDAIKNVLLSGETLTRGPEVEAFEKEFAAYCGAKHAISTSSCGAALKIANQVCHLTSKDEIICQANAFWVTIVNLIERNVKFKIADIDPENLNINPESVEKLVSPKTKAIVLMHHGGNPADLKPIREIAEKNDLIVIEDAAHSIGAEYKRKKIGNDSDLACFSFSSLKNIGTLGEGGMLLTNNDEFADMADKLRTNWPFGNKLKRKVKSLGKYNQPKSVAFLHMGDAWDYDWRSLDEIGTTARMSAVQAAVGRVQLKKLDSFNKRREDIAKKYNEEIIKNSELRTTKVLPGCKNAWHLFSYFINKNCNFSREKYVECMDKIFNIKTVIRFYPIHLGGIMRMMGHNQGECPVCEEIWFKEQLSLPISPQMPDDEIEYITDSINKTIIKLNEGGKILEVA